MQTLDAATRRFEAIKPLLDLAKRTHDAIQKRAQEIGVGVSTIYRWLKKYNPALGPQSLCGFSRLKALAGENMYADNGAGNDEDKRRDGLHNKCQMAKPSYWLCIETTDNWIADKVAGFTLLGIAENKRKAAGKMDIGDLLLTYIKGRGFADIRRVTKKGVVPLQSRVPYTDGVFPHAIHTEAIYVLPFDRHIAVNTIATRLTFCSTGPHWKHAFRHTLRKLDEKDGVLIEKNIHAAFLASKQGGNASKLLLKTVYNRRAAEPANLGFVGR